SPSMGESSDMPHKMKGTGGAGAGGNGLTPEEERLRAAAVRPAEWRREPRKGEQVITATDMFNGALKGIIHEFLCFSLFSDISEVTSPAERPYAESTADATAVGQMGTGVPGIVKGSVKTGVKVYAKSSMKALPNAAKIHNHHVFPQQFRKWFSSKGISNIDDYAVPLSSQTHLKGVHGRGLVNLQGRWNQRWSTFIKNNPNATPSEIFYHGESLLKEFGLEHLRYVPYK
ncbi:MAG: DUF2380 domain-containing protein, partial [Bacteroidota bacterium]